jgi:hypothetical protein
MRETLQAVERLAANIAYARQHDEFERLMVYGSTIDFARCVETLRELSRRLK